jgi:hypothetical protein
MNVPMLEFIWFGAMQTRHATANVYVITFCLVGSPKPALRNQHYALAPAHRAAWQVWSEWLTKTKRHF